MMIKITIRDNLSYCQEHRRMSVQTEDCLFCESECGVFRGDPEFQPDPDCLYCGGSGVEKFEHEPFILNLAEQNFNTVWSALGLDSPESGQMYPHLVQQALQSLDPAMLLRESRVGPGVFHDHGINQVRADWYLENLEQIVGEASRREEVLIWEPCYR